MGSNESVRDLTAAYRNIVSVSLLNLESHKNIKKFMIVRNPANRIVSAFVDKFCGEDAAADWVQEVVSSAGHRGEINFDDFLEYLMCQRHKDLNPHWRRQTFVIDTIDDVEFLSLERLDEQIQERRHLWGDRPDFAAAPKTQANAYRQWGIATADLRKMSNREIARQKAERGYFPNKREFLDNATKDVIRQIYRKDYSRLPYD